ncbi:hypothetical protein PPERSA_09719 [Pseudocohnilembus persalinus]|uniref:START domain-containing protein n=1 Tax=Pseudocohnilembus persalinus TaxID=266149 RepID=A0A0V0QV33_PSEPJ|nr:hypothetical protein PPERSA_09719 [Pseudocohnilembus persalinus]|eukprot:KRX06107.1 hypothetical protein PPERSA_09719 [Pseudocohnilembus persalinus]
MDPKNQEILNFISEILANSEFQEAQAQFFDKNCSHFENEDENKHIYNDLFKEYQAILDQSVESKLLTKFSEEEIAQFFEDFEKNYKNYDNKDVVEQLFIFTDFSKFKSTMLEYNQRNQGKLNEDHIQNNDEQITSNSEQVIDFSLFDSYKNMDPSKWKRQIKGKNEEDLFVYTMPFEKTGLDIMKAEWVLKDVSLQAVLNSMLNQDFDKLKKEQKMIKEAKVIKDFGPTNKIIYMLVDMPLLQKRDFVYQVGYQFNGDSTLVAMKSISHPEAPIRKGVIRAETKKYMWIQTYKEKHVKLLTIEQQNLKGSIPKIFMNMMIAKGGKQALKDWYKKVLEEEEKIQKQNK